MNLRRLGYVLLGATMLAACTSSSHPSALEDPQPTTEIATMSPSPSATASAAPKPSTSRTPSPRPSVTKSAIACAAVAAAAACSSHPPTSTPSTIASSGTLRLQQLGQYDQPVWAGVAPGDDRIFVVEKTGKIRILGQDAAFLDLSGKVSDGSEQGLLSMAFANDWTKSHRFYIDYTDKDGNSQVVEYTGSATKANTSTARTVLTQDQPYPNHNGGLLLMQKDNTMLIGFGDGGSGGDPQKHAQDMGSWLGKILRIDPRASGAKAYSVPGNNPYVHESGAKPEIYVLGVRNPWRFSIDPSTKDLWIGDVGQDQLEEVDDLPPSKASGANLGWSHYEGNSVYGTHPMKHADRYVPPVYQYSHSDGACSITGGVVYRGAIPKLRGTYLFTDICKSALRGLDVSTKKARTVMDVGQQVVSFGLDAHREVLVINLGGAVSRLVAG